MPSAMRPDILSNGVEKVAVIGAGPGGLAAAKYLRAEKSFSTIVVFEQRETVGGVWVATPSLVADETFTIPRTRPSQVLSLPVQESKGGPFEFISPVYDALDTNIPHTIMNYSDQTFPQDCSLFPQHNVVREYLERYADDVRPMIKLGTQILDVTPLSNTGKWVVKSRKIKDGRETTDVYDAVIVANGHYNDPFIPDIRGLQDFHAAHPGAISHSKFYRRQNEYEKKKVIIVGNSASGIDISAQISAISKLPLLISEKTSSKPDPEESTSTVLVPQITEFLASNRSVRFADGRIETEVDHIIFCTGYMYSFPFLTSLSPPLISTGERTQNLYQHIFYQALPTLSFIGLPQRIIPFPMSEGQAAVIARVLSGRLLLPPPTKMALWEKDLIADRGEGKAFHTLKFPLDAEYLNFLHDWALNSRLLPQLENGGRGKIPPCWGEREFWARERIYLIKTAARKLGENRFKVRTLEELGFDFEEWKRERGKK